VQNENKTHETWLAANDQQETLSKEDVIVGLDADYQQKVNEAWEIIDENERNEAITSANEIIMDKARERVQELNAILDADPANEEAQEELTIVERLIDDLNADKSTAVVAPEKVDPETLSKDVAVSELVSDYDARMEAIEAIEDAYDRQSKERELKQEVLVAARDEMERMNRLAEQNPESKTIEKRQKSLAKLEEEFEDLTIGDLGRVEKDLDPLGMGAVIAIGRVGHVAAGIADPGRPDTGHLAYQVLHAPEAAPRENRAFLMAHATSST